MKSVVKVVWSDKPSLILAKKESYDKIALKRGLEKEWELTEERRCVGFHSEPGEMTSCPDFKKIESGDQCPECRRKDIYTDWRTGKGTPDRDRDYSVYLAQCGKSIKVGVTKSSRLETRWKEQGADFAAEIEKNLNGEEALEKEQEISDKGLTERIRKEKKIEEADNRKLKSKMTELGYEDSKIQRVFGNSLKCKLITRKGRFPSPVKRIKGQIVSNGRIGLVMGSGKLMKKQQQQGLDSF